MPPRLEPLTKRWSTFDLPILPFLAPRVFQPWPRNLRTSHLATQAAQSRPDLHSSNWEDHEHLHQQSRKNQGRRQDVDGFKAFGVFESNLCHDSGTRDEIASQGADRIEDGQIHHEVVEASVEAEGEDELWAKYEEIWGSQAKTNPIGSTATAGRRVSRAGTDLVKRRSLNAAAQPEKSTEADEVKDGLLRKTAQSRKSRTTSQFKYMAGVPVHGPSWLLKRLEKAKERRGLERKEARFKAQHEVAGLPKVRVKFVRLAPEGDFGNYSFSSSWNWRYAMLNARYDSAMKGGRIRPRIFTYNEPRVTRTFCKTLVEQKPRHLIKDAWMKMTIERRRYIWKEVMFVALEDYPDDALSVLDATFMEPYPPGYAIADSLDYIVSHYLRHPENYPPRVRHAVVNSVRRIFDEGPKDHVHLLQRTIYRLMDLLNGHFLNKFYLKLVEVDHPLHENTLIQFGTRLAKLGKLDTACAVVQRLKDQGADFSTSKVLSLCSNLLARKYQTRSGGSRYPESEIFQFMLGAGAKPNLITYNILLQNALEAGDHKTGWQLHDMMMENGLQPDAYTYSLLLNDSKLRMDPPAIKRVMEYVREKGIRSSRIATDILHAILLLQQQERQGYDKALGPMDQQQPTFDRLLQVYCEHFNLEPLARIIPNFTESYPNLCRTAVEDSHGSLEDPSGPTLVIMITGFLDNLQTSYPAKLFYDQFRDLVLTNDPVVASLMGTTHVWNLILMAFAKFPERLADCPNLVGDMLSASDRMAQLSHVSSESGEPASQPAPQAQPVLFTPPKPDTYTWSILLNIFMDNSQPLAAEKVLTMMRERGIPPSQITWNSLAHGYARLQDTVGVVDVVKRLEEEGGTADDWTMSALSRIKNRRALIGEMKRREADTIGSVSGRNGEGTVGKAFIEDLKENLEEGVKDEEGKDGPWHVVGYDRQEVDEAK